MVIHFHISPLLDCLSTSSLTPALSLVLSVVSGHALQIARLFLTLSEELQNCGQ